MINTGLRYFAAVARNGSIRLAAEELHVAQSALSRQIHKLEEELGAPLFQRHARGVDLTSAGEILLGFAQTSLRQVERVRSEVDALKGLRRGTVHVYSIESLVPHLLPRVIARFGQRYPGINFDITIDGSDHVIAAVREGRTDIGLAFYAPPDPELSTVFRTREPLVATMSAQHPLANRAKVSLAECAAYPIAAPMPNTGSRIVIDVACKAVGVHMKPVLETNSIPLRVSFVHTGSGITFLSRLSAWDSLRSGELVAVPIRDRIVNTATIDAVTHASRQLPLVAEEFLRAVQGELQNLRSTSP
ncbi:MAG TPA: LysR substrate-binding domain-containing protein [Reyranella sp.]|nr:LysR substrate-binding domain-containing protein [Reyranella sp.]